MSRAIHLLSYLVSAIAGVVIFGGLASTWFTNLMAGEEQPNNVSLAIDLFILGLNLFVAGRVLMSVVL